MREVHGEHAGFLVRKKTFAWFLNNHHGDGIVSVSCKVGPGDNTALSKAQPDRFYLPAYVAHRGWVALRLDVGEVDWDEVSEFGANSYRRVAPKPLAILVNIGGRSVSVSELIASPLAQAVGSARDRESEAFFGHTLGLHGKTSADVLPAY